MADSRSGFHGAGYPVAALQQLYSEQCYDKQCYEEELGSRKRKHPGEHCAGGGKHMCFGFHVSHHDAGRGEQQLSVLRQQAGFKPDNSVRASEMGKLVGAFMRTKDDFDGARQVHLNESYRKLDELIKENYQLREQNKKLTADLEFAKESESRARAECESSCMMVRHQQSSLQNTYSLVSQQMAFSASFYSVARIAEKALQNFPACKACNELILAEGRAYHKGCKSLFHEQCLRKLVEKKNSACPGCAKSLKRKESWMLIGSHLVKEEVLVKPCPAMVCEDVIKTELGNLPDEVKSYLLRDNKSAFLSIMEAKPVSLESGALSGSGRDI